MGRSGTLWPVIKNHSLGFNYLMSAFSQLRVMRKVMDNKIIYSEISPQLMQRNRTVHKHSLHQLCFPYLSILDLLWGKEVRP